MENYENVNRRHRLSWGIVLIVIGAVLGLQFAGMLPEPLYFALFRWQSIFLAIALAKLIQGEFRASLVCLAIGVATNYYGWSRLIDSLLSDGSVNGREISAIFWAALFVGVGLILIFTKPRHNNHFKAEGGFAAKHGHIEQNTDNEGRIDYNFCFSGSEQVFMEPVFRGGNIKATCGGIMLDLRHTTLPEGDTTLNIDATCGGFTLKVPSNWKVVNQCSFVLGGITDKRFAVDMDNTRRLIITGRCVMGGGSIE
ncbi:MAG: hypothetical protein IKZ99_06145 [Salinivirgaceae bacterium]|nr:hypothetical protein [Salinivirgaceae bacterium]